MGSAGCRSGRWRRFASQTPSILRAACVSVSRSRRIENVALRAFRRAEEEDDGEEAVRQIGEKGVQRFEEQGSRKDPEAAPRGGEIQDGGRSEVRAAGGSLVETALTGVKHPARLRPAAWWLCFLLLGAPGIALATSVVPLDLSALCREADLVFVGTVREVNVRWIDRQRDEIETAVTFENLQWLHGGPRSEVVLRFPGGELDGIHESIAGIPTFRSGETWVIFAREDGTLSPIVGFHQGAMRVVEGDAGPEVEAPARLLGMADGGGDGGGSSAANSASSQLELGSFLERVRTQLAQPTDQP
jgi:hypothetical protein